MLELLQVREVHTATGADVIDRATPHSDLPLAVEGLVPDPYDKGMGIALQ